MQAFIRQAPLLITLTLLAPPVLAETLYRWVDANGRVTYQGQPPINQQFTREEITPTRGPASESTVQPVKIILYAIKVCKACDLAREDLVARGLKFTEIDPEQSPEAGKSLLEKHGKVEVPLLLVGNAVVKGYNPVWLEAELEKAGVDSANDGSTTKNLAQPRGS